MRMDFTCFVLPRSKQACKNLQLNIIIATSILEPVYLACSNVQSALQSEDPVRNFFYALSHVSSWPSLTISIYQLCTCSIQRLFPVVLFLHFFNQSVIC